MLQGLTTIARLKMEDAYILCNLIGESQEVIRLYC
jgi:hypothetical protein